MSSGRSIRIEDGLLKKCLESQTFLSTSALSHVRLSGDYGRHLIVEIIQYTFVDCSALLYGSIREEALDILLQPIVSIGDVAIYALVSITRRVFSWQEAGSESIPCIKNSYSS